MKPYIMGLLFCMAGISLSHAQAKLPDTQTAQTATNEEQEMLNLSRSKWTWMASKSVDSLDQLFTDKCVFVHMGGSWGKKQELETIQRGGIWYKKAEVYGASVNFFGNTAVLLNDIDLLAEVGGREVVHGFMVTEVYVKDNGKWKMGSLTFSTLLRPVKMKTKIQQSH